MVPGRSVTVPSVIGALIVVLPAKPVEKPVTVATRGMAVETPPVADWKIWMLIVPGAVYAVIRKTTLLKVTGVLTVYEAPVRVVAAALVLLLPLMPHDGQGM